MNPYSELILNHNINDENYYDDKNYVSNSMLSLCRNNSSKAFWYMLDNKQESEAFAFGSAFHCLALETKMFNDRYIYAPNVDKRTKAGKEEYAEFLESVKDKTVLPHKYYNILNGMYDELYAHGVVNNAKDIITNSNCSYEENVCWKNKRTFIKCKGKFDIVNHKDKYIADLKTTQDASMEGFKKSICNFKYHKQAAFYLDALGFNDYYIIAVEKKEPYGIGIYKLGNDLIEQGRQLYNEELDMYCSMMTSGERYDYNESKVVLIDKF